MTDLAQAMVEYFEGLSLTAYKDTKGLWTIGYGHLLDQNVDWTGHTITAEVADSLLEGDMDDAYTEARQFPNFNQAGDVRQAVLVSMCFQMGSKPLYWPVFNAALEVQDWKGAAAAGLNSEWAKQTPARAELEMTMLDSGEWEIPDQS